MADAKRIVVVGGGIAGLAAARAACLRGRETGRPVSVTVLEGSGRFGGNLLTEKTEGFLLDAGPDSWVVTKPHATALARTLGLGGSLIETKTENRRYFVAWGDTLHPVPEGLVLGVPTQLRPLATTNLFTWRGKARMALEPFVSPRRFHGDDDESIAEFATRRLGKEAAERLVAPLLGGISAGDASDISVRAAFPQLVTMERDYGSLVQGMRVARKARAGGSGSAFTSLEGGTGQLVSTLVDRLRADLVTLHADRRVDAVAREGGAWAVHTEGGERVIADAVVVAVPAFAAAAMLEGLDDALSSALRSIVFGSTATVFLGYRTADVKHPLDGVGFVVPRAAGRPILASTWVSSKWAGRAPEGHVLLRAFFGGAWGEDVLSHDDEALARVARTELRTLMGIDAEPVLTRVFRFDKASAQMRVGHLVTMRTLRERLEAAAPGLRIAGGGYDGVGIPDSIRQGEEAGRALV
ncbi:MAG TPA: protoporphyrinogen oxidase [Polyangiaceae bacterium]